MNLFGVIEEERSAILFPFCYPGKCDKGICTYEVSYLTESVTSGELAKVKFTVNSDNGVLQSLDIIIGCGFKQKKFEPFFGSGFQRGKPDVIAGILGIDGGPMSFLSQLGPTANRRFSYCLMPYTNGTSSNMYLRFGLDAEIGGDGQQVYATSLNAYYLNLEDISISGNAIGFQRRDFEYKENIRRGGCFIDSGSPITCMQGTIFDRVAERVIAYFQQLYIHHIFPRIGFSLCFAKPNKAFAYPIMAYHFQHAIFVLDKTNTVFSITDNDFC